MNLRQVAIKEHIRAYGRGLLVVLAIVFALLALMAFDGSSPVGTEPGDAVAYVEDSAATWGGAVAGTASIVGGDGSRDGGDPAQEPAELSFLPARISGQYVFMS